jgi:ABC-type polysaccharide/polyol phosphate transport system ATPase subunit
LAASGGNVMGTTTRGVSISDAAVSAVASSRLAPEYAGRTPGAHAVVLEAEGVSKSFAGIEALRDVDFDLMSGEVHALMGENGAGKSTLMKILAGVHVDYEGAIRLAGAPARL